MRIIKLIFYLLLLIIFSTNNLSEVYAASSTLSFSPVSGNFTTGQTFDVAVNLNTGGANVAGVDIVILFDQTKLQIVEIIEGNVFDQYIGEVINNTKGHYIVSVLAASQQDLFTGTGTILTIRFKAYSPGSANVVYHFTAGSTTDSNVADYATSTDILTSVTNATYSISGTPIPGSSGVPPSGTDITPGSSSSTTGSGTTGTTGRGTGGIGGPIASSSATPTATVVPTKPVPVTATNFPTTALVLSGIIFVIIGYFGSNKLFK